MKLLIGEAMKPLFRTKEGLWNTSLYLLFQWYLRSR